MEEKISLIIKYLNSRKNDIPVFGIKLLKTNLKTLTNHFNVQLNNQDWSIQLYSQLKKYLKFKI